jgi:hypothetical protein
VVDLRTHLRRAARKRWANATDEEKKAAGAKAGAAYWSKLTPEQRSEENRRRARVRTRNRARRRKRRK